MILLPLILIEIYLISTLIIFKFGPIVWDLDNPIKFWFLIFSYHIAFIAGYLICVKNFKKNNINNSSEDKIEKFIYKYFWIYLFIALIGTLISYKNACHTDSYIPYNLFTDFYNGLMHPGIVRHEFISSLDTYKSNKTVTIFYSLIVFIKYSLIPILVFMWNKLEPFKKYSALFIALIPFMGTVSIGTNKSILDILIMFSLVLLVVILSAKKGERIKSLIQRKTIILIIISLAIFFPYYFNKSMSERSATFQYMEEVSTENKIKIPFYHVSNEDDTKILSPKMMEAYIKISTYLTQGYYGMSLAIDKEFDSTFGIGHSYFLLDQVNYFFNINLIEKTFQYKINDQWDRLVQWHSFYSQIANDVSFYGVIVVMFIIGFLLSSIYISAIKSNNIIAKTMLPLFAIMFVYMPANNQVFNFMESLFSFICLLLMWFIFSFKLSKIKGNENDLR